MNDIPSTAIVLICSHAPLLTQPHDQIAKKLSELEGDVYDYIAFSPKIQNIIIQSEKLKKIIAGAYVLTGDTLCRNYDEIRTKSGEAGIVTFGYGVTELRTLGDGRPTKRFLSFHDGKLVKISETEIKCEKSAAICTTNGFLEKSYGKNDRRYSVPKDKKADPDIRYNDNVYNDCDSKDSVVKFFLKDFEITECFKKKMDALAKLKEEKSPFARALPRSLLYTSESCVDASICGYVMDRFSRPFFDYIGEFRYATFGKKCKDGNVELTHMKMMASLAECFVFYHARDIFFSDIKPDNFFVDSSDFSVFPIDSDGFSYHGGYCDPPLENYSDAAPKKIDKSYCQPLSTELYGLSALIFNIFFNEDLKGCPHDFTVKDKKVAAALNNSRKLLPTEQHRRIMEKDFYERWFSYPQYIRNAFINIKSGIYPSAFDWKCLFDRYIKELSPTSVSISEAPTAESVQQQRKLEQKIKEAEKKCKELEESFDEAEKKYKNLEESFDEAEKNRKKTENEVESLKDKLKGRLKSRTIALILFVILLLFIAAVAAAVYIYTGSPEMSLAASPNVDTEPHFVCEAEETNYNNVLNEKSGGIHYGIN